MHKGRMAVALALIALPAAALAHHGWSSYNTDKTTRLAGPFTSVSWSNPHGTATMNWQGKEWDVILAPVSRMEARGLTPAMIAPGKRIRIVGYPRKDGTAEMRLERIIVGDKTIELR
ncbi:DUF6152 family protein [Allosphingosinicella sp.]|uniref:DUF6152 family protein n=1 Tax=Allosphingosinicella sp. TaxID=2823234 RepID=UPI002FC1E4DF